MSYICTACNGPHGDLSGHITIACSGESQWKHTDCSGWIDGSGLRCRCTCHIEFDEKWAQLAERLVQLVKSAGRSWPFDDVQRDKIA